MSAMEEIRKKQSDIKHQFKPIQDMYALLDMQQDGDSQLDKEEHDKIRKLQSDWDNLVFKSEKIRNDLHGKQADFKKKLIENIGLFITDVDEFHENFINKGPNQVAKDPKEANNRLKMFTEEYQVRKRKYDSYYKGEVLFGLPHAEYKNLVKVENEITRLEKLYGLYSRVNNQIAEWQEVPWGGVKDKIQEMQDTVERFEGECRRLPVALKDKQAFKDLEKAINDMKNLLEILPNLSKSYVKDRHWEEIM